MDAERVRAAQGDAWFALGRAHAATGGAVAEFPGVRLMASGLPQPQWNGGHVDDTAAVDLDQVRRWYAARALPCGLLVPTDQVWSAGRLLTRKRLMSLALADFVPAEKLPALTISRAQSADLEAILTTDSMAFETDHEEARGWLAPKLAAREITTALVRISGKAAATAHIVMSDGRAGRTAYLAGVGVQPWARRRGVAAALSTWLIERAFAGGAQFAHLNPDSDAAARVYARLGFIEVDGFNICVDH